MMISKLKSLFRLKKKELQEIYNFKNIFNGTLIVFFLLSLLDGFDIPSKTWEILGTYNLCVMVLLVVFTLSGQYEKGGSGDWLAMMIIF